MEPPLTLRDAIVRHSGEAKDAAKKFKCLKPADREALLTFLQSL